MTVNEARESLKNLLYSEQDHDSIMESLNSLLESTNFSKKENILLANVINSYCSSNNLWNTNLGLALRQVISNLYKGIYNKPIDTPRRGEVEGVNIEPTKPTYNLNFSSILFISIYNILILYLITIDYFYQILGFSFFLVVVFFFKKIITGYRI